jgi:hypothetical protein
MELNVDTLNLTSRCARCNALYYERDNVGSWHCAQHPGRWNGDMSGYKYSKGHWDCCGYSGVPYDKSFERGCQPADHRSEANAPYIVDDDIRLYRYQNNCVRQVQPKAIKPNAETSQYVLVSRFDPDDRRLTEPRAERVAFARRQYDKWSASAY